jgi:hypothetical protein
MKKALVVLAVLLLLFWNPRTRAFLLFLLPLGSGVDDLVFLVLLAVVGVLALVIYVKGRKE